MDNNATTKVAPEVLEAMIPYLRRLLRQSVEPCTRFGGQVEAAISEAQERRWPVCWAAKPEEIVFTSCGTESDSTAILSALQSFS